MSTRSYLARATGRPFLTGWDLGFLVLRYGTLAFILAMILVPFLLVVNISVRPAAEFFNADPHVFTRNPTLKAWEMSLGALRKPLVNSALIASGTALVSMFITIPGAYVFARQEFPGRKVGFYLIVAALLFPYILLIIPITEVWYNVGLYDTIPGVVLAYQVFVTPFAIWILRDFFEKLPTNLEEAAQVYGCTQFQAFYRVILPLSAPAVVATGFIAFLVGWNDFLFSGMLTTGTGPRPAVVHLYVLTTGSEINFWAQTMAQTIIIGIPPTVLYMVSRRYLTESFEVR